MFSSLKLGKVLVGFCQDACCLLPLGSAGCEEEHVGRAATQTAACCSWNVFPLPGLLLSAALPALKEVEEQRGSAGFQGVSQDKSWDFRRNSGFSRSSCVVILQQLVCGVCEASAAQKHATDSCVRPDPDPTCPRSSWNVFLSEP